MRIGKVVGTFHGGVNALFGSEALVTFHSPDVPLQPWGVAAVPPWKQVSEGERVVVSGGHIRVGVLSFSLEDAEVFDLRLSPLAERALPQVLSRRLQVQKDLFRSQACAKPELADDGFERERQRILDGWALAPLVNYRS